MSTVSTPPPPLELRTGPSSLPPTAPVASAAIGPAAPPPPPRREAPFDDPVAAGPGHHRAPDAPAAPPTWEVAPNGRIRERHLPSGVRHAAVAMHLWPLAGVILGPLAVGLPLAIWLLGREGRPFLDDHGRETLNFQISVVLISLILTVSIAGAALLPIYWVAAFVFTIRAAVIASAGEYHRYPMTFRWIPDRG